jgi:hypothetical protein
MRFSNTKSNYSFNRFERFKNFKRLKFYLSFLRNIDRRSIQAVEGIRKFFNWIIQNILILATIVTAIAALITIFFTVLEPAKIEMQAGSFIAISPCECSKTDNSRYFLQIPVSFYNGGAKPGIIERVGLAIKDPSNNMFAYFFKSDFDTVLKEENGKKIWQLNSAFSSIIIPPRNAISRTLGFETFEFNFLPNKSYDFWVLVWDKESMNPTYRVKFSYLFENHEIKKVEEIRQKQKSLSSKDGNTVISAEDGKYGPIVGGIDYRTYQSLTGSN